MKKKQLHEALAVLLTKLSSARDNPLLMDNYAVKALRTVLLNFKESGELHEAYKERKAKGEELLAALNPAIKEKQETEKRFKALEGDISGIRGMVKQLLDKLG